MPVTEVEEMYAQTRWWLCSFYSGNDAAKELHYLTKLLSIAKDTKCFRYADGLVRMSLFYCLRTRELDAFPLDYKKSFQYAKIVGNTSDSVVKSCSPYGIGLLALHDSAGWGVNVNRDFAVGLWKEAARLGDKASQEVLIRDGIGW
jgi:hypothetical protein